jgi:hypothetical protein
VKILNNSANVQISLSSVFFLVASQAALAQSAGCLAIDGNSNASFSYAPYGSFASQPFDEGDVVTLTATNADTNWEWSTGNQGSIPGSPVYQPGAPVSESLTVPAGGLPSLGIYDTNLLGPGTMTNLSVSCTPANAAPGVPPGAPGGGGATIANDPVQAVRYVAPNLARSSTEAQIGAIGSAITRRFGQRGTEEDASFVSAVMPLMYAASSGTAISNSAANSAAEIANAISGVALSGTADDQFAIWTSTDFSLINSTLSGSAFDGHSASLTIGGDVKLGDQFLAGLAISGIGADIDTDFNDGNLSSRGIGITPYFAYNIVDGLILDGAVGYTALNYGIQRGNGAISGEFDADRFYGTVGLSGTSNLGDFSVTPGLRALYINEGQDGYVDSLGTTVSNSDFDLGTLTASLNVSYRLDFGGTQIEPFVRVEGEWMFLQPEAVTLADGRSYQLSDLDGAIALGAAMSANGVSASLEVRQSDIFEDSMSATSVKASLAVSF